MSGSGSGKPERVRMDIAAGVVPDTHLRWAEAMIESGYDKKLMYVPLAAWYWWDGKRWRKDPEGKRVAKIVYQFALMYREAPYAVDDSDVRKKLVGLVSKAETDGHVRAVMGTLSAYLAEDIETLDEDVWLLNTPAGILDLRTRDVWPHEPKRKMTMITGGVWDPDSLRDSQFLDAVRAIIPVAERRDYLQEMMGLGLVGEMIEQISILMYGPTARNGKSTLGEAIQSAVGGYSTTGDPGILTKTDKHEENIAALHHKRVVQFSELPEDKTLAAAGFKRLTGDDSISARFLFKDRFTYVPGFTMIIRANDLPYVPGDDEGTWRRLRVVLFDQVFSGAADNRGLRGVLRGDRAELNACLTWMVEGLARYLSRPERERYFEPDCVTQDTTELRDQNDNVGQFLRERTEKAESATQFLSYNDLWMAFIAWHSTQSEKQGMGQTALTRKLKKRPGMRHVMRNGTRGVTGVKLSQISFDGSDGADLHITDG